MWIPCLQYQSLGPQLPRPNEELNQGTPTDELLRQALLQSANTLPALVQGIRCLGMNKGRILSQSNQVQLKSSTYSSYRMN